MQEGNQGKLWRHLIDRRLWPSWTAPGACGHPYFSSLRTHHFMQNEMVCLSGVMNDDADDGQSSKLNYGREEDGLKLEERNEVGRWLIGQNEPWAHVLKSCSFQAAVIPTLSCADPAKLWPQMLLWWALQNCIWHTHLGATVSVRHLCWKGKTKFYNAGQRSCDPILWCYW